ncbi:(2Fe-2S) ferredoxin domain-containing protein [Paenibacillus sp. Soil787]|uniref:(2Fe-2S) ferredoxin domain-containing protein n=1 Tax=Paenibacillus sp. Soil787 TaxID=1736411 RepID=UPI000703BBA2|nr:(2Fe-2S) ferredoxin domain-containing protein [Paenibacillus sp. Soil787]KRF22540.1 hypothetical protein ASG93_29945 [Paenibacillus sp. Soil787]
MGVVEIRVCMKQRSFGKKICCCDMGAAALYEAFKTEIKNRHLTEYVEVRKSGCLDKCEAGPVACFVNKGNIGDSWLADKIKSVLPAKKVLYEKLTPNHVPYILDSLLPVITRK